MNSNNLFKIKEKLASGGFPIGTHCQIGEPIVTDILCNCGFDFIWLDGEHGSMDRKDINHQIVIVRGAGLAPFVRVPWNDHVQVKPVLDMGPAAIVFPFIRTVEEAKSAVASCKYPPAGIRGFGPIKANNYSTLDGNEYLEISKKEPWIILQIEHIDGVNNLSEIIKVEGVDTIVVGTNDMAGSIGLLGQTRHPEVLKLLDKIEDVCNKANFPFGASLWYNEVMVKEWIDRGAKWICLDTDISYLVNGGRNTISKTMDLFSKRKIK